MSVLRTAPRAALLVVVPVLAVLGLAGAAAPPGQALVSATPGGAYPEDGPSYDGAVAPSGKFVVFTSLSSSLVGSPATVGENVWIRDVKKGTTALVSATAAGGEPNGDSGAGAVSNNGAVIVYQSLASNIVPGATDGFFNVYLADRKAGRTIRLSESMSGGGGDWDSYAYGATVSGNGKTAVFCSAALDLVPDPGDGWFQIYAYDVRKGTLTLLSRAPDGAPADGNCYDPSISANGRFVAFYSYATNLADGPGGEVANVYVADVRKGTVTLVTRDFAGGDPSFDCYYPVVSSNGKVVAFESSADDLIEGSTNGPDDTDVYVADLKAGTLIRASSTPAGGRGNGSSFGASLASNGKSVAFCSSANDLVAGDGNGARDLFVLDLKKNAVRRVGLGAAGEEGNGHSYTYAPSLSSNGKWIASTSNATNLVSGASTTAESSWVLVAPAK